MFTGIVENTGVIKKTSRRGNYRELIIAPEPMFDGLTIGESIAVSGPCLTVIDFNKETFTVEASQETLSLTTLGAYKSGQSVNLERALRADARLGGHFVSGHIDTVLKIKGASDIGRSMSFEIELPRKFDRLVVSQGSVALNGVSLTVTSVSSKRFTVNLIPETQRSTTLNSLKAGDEINVEFDLMGKYILRHLDLMRSKEKLSFEKMTKWGY